MNNDQENNNSFVPFNILVLLNKYISSVSQIETRYLLMNKITIQRLIVAISIRF
jgi:hypothetical protein